LIPYPSQFLLKKIYSLFGIYDPLLSQTIITLSFLIIPGIFFFFFFDIKQLFGSIKFDLMFLVFLSVFFGLIAGAYLQSLISMVFLKGKVISDNYIEGLRFFMNYPAIYPFILMVILAPIQEEFYFRGTISLIKNIVSKKVYPYLFVIVSGLIFAISHLDFPRIPYLLFIGMLFAIIYLITGNLIYSIICHFMINFMSFLSLYASRGIDIDTNLYSELLTKSGYYGYLALFILFAGLSGVTLKNIYEKINKNSDLRS